MTTNTPNTVPTAQDDDSPFVSYNVGSTPEDTFVIPFQFWQNEDLTVQFEGVDQVGWNTTGAGNPTGGSLILSVPVADGVLTIQRYVQEDRITVFPIAGPFRIEQLNTELDHIIAMIGDRRFVDEQYHPVGSLILSELNEEPTQGEWLSLGSESMFGTTVYAWRRTA